MKELGISKDLDASAPCSTLVPNRYIKKSREMVNDLSHVRSRALTDRLRLLCIVCEEMEFDEYLDRFSCSISYLLSAIRYGMNIGK